MTIASCTCFVWFKRFYLAFAKFSTGKPPLGQSLPPQHEIFQYTQFTVAKKSDDCKKKNTAEQCDALLAHKSDGKENVPGKKTRRQQAAEKENVFPLNVTRHARHC